MELKAQEGHGVRLFRGLSEAVIGKCLTVERVGYVEDPFLVSATSTKLFQSSAGRSTSGMGQGPFVMYCGAFEDVPRGARAGAILLKFFLSFSCLPMHLSVSASSFLIDAGTSARPASGNWAHS